MIRIRVIQPARKPQRTQREIDVATIGPQGTIMLIGDRRYRTTAAFEMTASDGAIAISPQNSDGSPIQRKVNECEHCHRGDWETVVYRSVEEAVVAGLLVEV